MADDTHPGVDPERMVGERIADRFVVERAIGQGPLSSAFRAHDDRLHRRVTVKLFHPRHRDDVQVVRSQLNAARAVARLSHEHLAMVIDQGEHDGMPLIVFEYVRGENLQERIDRYAPLAVGEVARLGLQIARALTYAHGHGVVHGNVRPENVLLTEDRDVKLVDFGGGSYVAQLVGDPYAAPELAQVDPGAPAEATDDVFALGAVLFAALTESQARPDIVGADVQLLRPDISQRLASVIARSLAADPARRFGSMREVAAELAATQEQVRHDVVDRQATRAFGAVSVEPDATQEFDVAAVTVDTGGAGAPPPRKVAPRRRRERTGHERRARVLAWSMVVVPLAALAIVGIMIAGERSQEPKGKPDARAAGPVREIAVSSVVSMDPDGDGSEHEEKTANIIDGDTTTTWQTDGYDTQTFAGLKPGVGVVLQLAEPADVRDVQIFTRLPNWKVQVYAAAAPTSDLADWTPVSDVTSVRNADKIPVDLRKVRFDGMEDGRAGVLLLWITGLSLDVDDASKYRARMSEVLVHGATSGA